MIPQGLTVIFLKVFPEANQDGNQVLVFFRIEDGIQPETQYIDKYTRLLESLDHIIQTRHRGVFAGSVSINPGQAGVKQIFLKCPIEYKGCLGHKPHIPGDITLGKIRNLLFSYQDMPARVFIKLTDTMGQSAFAAAGKSDQCHVLSGV